MGVSLLIVFIVQGEVHIYGSHSELAGKNIDTTQLLGLIHQKSDERDEFAYKADSDEGEWDYCYYITTKWWRR